jgi:cephalosporin hydroxylase
MKLTLDTAKREIVEQKDGVEQTASLYTPEAFEMLTRQWLAVGWALKYSYGFTWLGRPIIQMPEDMVRIQEVIFRLKPDVIVETGVAHGGSLIYYASLCQLLGKGKVIGVDVEIRPHNRKAIEEHFLAAHIHLIEGDSVGEPTLAKVREHTRAGDQVLVLLDSCHSRDHVLAELKAYAGFVSKESYIVATDGIMRDLADVPGGQADWSWNNPCRAVEEFLRDRGDFILEEPPFPFNEGKITQRVTHWPTSYLKRVA